MVQEFVEDVENCKNKKKWVKLRYDIDLPFTRMFHKSKFVVHSFVSRVSTSREPNRVTVFLVLVEGRNLFREENLFKGWFSWNKKEVFPCGTSQGYYANPQMKISVFTRVNLIRSTSYDDYMARGPHQVK